MSVGDPIFSIPQFPTATISLRLALPIHPPNVASTATLQELRVVAVDHRVGGKCAAMRMSLVSHHWRIRFSPVVQ